MCARVELHARDVGLDVRSPGRRCDQDGEQGDRGRDPQAARQAPRWLAIAATTTEQSGSRRLLGLPRGTAPAAMTAGMIDVSSPGAPGASPPPLQNCRAGGARGLRGSVSWRERFSKFLITSAGAPARLPRPGACRRHVYRVDRELPGRPTTCPSAPEIAPRHQRLRRLTARSPRPHAAAPASAGQPPTTGRFGAGQQTTRRNFDRRCMKSLPRQAEGERCGARRSGRPRARRQPACPCSAPSRSCCCCRRQRGAPRPWRRRARWAAPTPRRAAHPRPKAGHEVLTVAAGLPSWNGTRTPVSPVGTGGSTTP